MKISYSLRAFGIYFVILGTLLWFTLDNAIERLNDGMRQSAESVLVDIANILAVLIEDELAKGNSAPPLINTSRLDRVFHNVELRKLSAQIYKVSKTSIDSQVYVTNAKGIVIYDSENRHIGEDFSYWRDVNLTLKGEYGARTSYISREFTAPDDPKAMVIAAPIMNNNKIIGVVSVLKPISSLEGHLLTESKQLQRYGFALLVLALVLGYLLSLWFTHSINRIASYANDMAEGKTVEPPISHDSRLSDLTQSISYMRSQLDGKEYVENYIHSLTHELKTPITSIRGAVELISENMPPADRARFINNISTSNHRMSRLVDRMLSLAKLEGKTELVDTNEFNLSATIERLLSERSPTTDGRRLNIEFRGKAFLCAGDKILIGQAVANLLDNAISFCNVEGTVRIELQSRSNEFCVRIFNQGEPIPEFAIDKLFDRFFSLPRPTIGGQENSQSQLTKSTGLGLSFVHEIMKLHRGQVTVRNVHDGVLAILIWPK